MLTSSSYVLKMAHSYENVADKILLLKDGYKIFESDYKKLLLNLFNMAIEHEKAFMELVTKCIIPEYTMSQEAQQLLQIHQLMSIRNEKYLNSGMPNRDVFHVIYHLLDKYGFKNIQAIKYSLSSWFDLEIEYMEAFSKIIKKMIFSGVSSVDELVSSQHEKMILKDIRRTEIDFDRVKNMLLKHNQSEKLVDLLLKERPVTENDIIPKAYAALRGTKPAEISMLPSNPTLKEKFSEDATVNAKIMSFLAQHKYELLFIAALASYGIYDHYHENRIGKAVVSVKDNLFIMWQKVTSSPVKEAKDKKQEEEGDYQLDGFPGLSF